MAGRISAFLVDLDDTLASEHDYVFSGYRAVAAFLAGETGLDAGAIEARLRYEFLKYGRTGAFDRLYAHFGWAPERDVPGIKALVSVYRDHAPELNFYPGAEAALAALREIAPVAIVTDGAAAMQSRKARALGLYDRTDAVILCDEVGAAKPDPAGYREAAARLGAAIDTVVIVGDDPYHDLAAAAALGVRAVRVRTGRLAALATPSGFSADFELSAFAELPTVL